MLLTMLPESAVLRMIDNAQITMNRLALQKSPPDHHPVVRLFVPDTGVSMLLAEYDPVSQEFFGICDHGIGRIEIGVITLAEIESLQAQPIHVDYDFIARGTLMDYLTQSFRKGHITLALPS